MKTCDHCKIQHICSMMDKFKQPLLDTRLCIKFGDYPEVVADVYKVLANHCIYYDPHKEDEED